MKSNFLTVNPEITLHAPRVEMAADFYRIIRTQRPYLQEWLPFVSKIHSEKDLRIHIKGTMMQNKSGNQLFTFIYYQGKLVGSLAFIKIDKHNKWAELGYWLHQELQGQGIITQSCARLIDYGFKALRLQKIRIQTTPANLKSQYIPQKLGFTQEGILRKEAIILDKPHDLIQFGLLKPEWKNPY